MKGIRRALLVLTLMVLCMGSGGGISILPNFTCAESPGGAALEDAG
jgi:hypothetical protein